MDICRGVLIAMFLDYPLSKIVDVVCDNKNYTTDDYLKPIEHLMRWRLKELTLTDTSAICKRLKQRLEIKNRNTFVGLLGYLIDNQYNSVLTGLDEDEPKVVYEHLFRWMEAVKYIDPDLLTIANMVNVDKSHEPRTSFIWNIVHSASENVFSDNDVLKIDDLHAHLNVFGDRFYVHWIDLMNRFCLRVKKKEDIKEEGDILLDEWSVKNRQFAPIVLWKEKYADKSYMDWVGLASVIRYYLFRFLKEQKTITPKEKTAIRDDLMRSDIVSILNGCCSYVSAYRATAFSEYIGKAYIDKAWDYCVQKDIVDDKAKKSPNCLFLGERWLVYNVLFKIVKDDNDVEKIAPWFYLYLLIKNRIRMEHYLSNELVGLANYNLSVQNSNNPITKVYWFIPE